MVSSLNATLARLSAIESNFNTLEVYSNRINQSYALKNYGSTNETKEVQGDNFAQVLDTKEKVERKSEEIFEQALDMLQTQEAGAKSVLMGKIEENAKTSSDTLKEKLKNIVPLETLKGKIEGQTPNDTFREKLSQSAPKSIDEVISETSKKYGMNENFIRAIIKQESGFNPNATSKKGAMGLMQLMPKTAEGLGVIDAYNPQQNVEGGVKYIKSLIDKYDGDMIVALAAYNAGPTAVSRYGGVPPYKETQNYVNKVMEIYEKSNEVNL